jgi:hypothetical protein
MAFSDAGAKVRALGIANGRPRAREPSIECLSAKTMEMKSGKWRCSACNKEYREEKQCNRHLVVHGAKRFQCPYPGCLYKCAVNDMLIRHRRIHSERKDYRCRFHPCQAKFKGVPGRRFHERSTHLNVRKFACAICHVPFVSDGGRLEHEACVHGMIGKNTGGFCRKGCGRAYLKPSKLSNHESKCLFQASSIEDRKSADDLSPNIVSGGSVHQVGDRIVDRISLK